MQVWVYSNLAIHDLQMGYGPGKSLTTARVLAPCLNFVFHNMSLRRHGPSEVASRYQIKGRIFSSSVAVGSNNMKWK
jgi:hypothetical protein